jgi:hypothetical protein
VSFGELVSGVNKIPFRTTGCTFPARSFARLDHDFAEHDAIKKRDALPFEGSQQIPGLANLCNDSHVHGPIYCTLQKLVRIPTIATTHSDGSRPAVPIDRDQCGAGAEGAVG